MEWLIVNPSVEMQPTQRNASPSGVFASSGTAVPAGATKTAPPAFGLPVVTFA